MGSNHRLDGGPIGRVLPQLLYDEVLHRVLTPTAYVLEYHENMK